jgi:hypothetical protein
MDAGVASISTVIPAVFSGDPPLESAESGFPRPAYPCRRRQRPADMTVKNGYSTASGIGGSLFVPSDYNRKQPPQYR